MQTQTPDPPSHVQHKRQQFPWLVGMIMSSVFIIAFVVITLLILRSQGPTQSINTLTILSIVGSFVIGVLSLLFSYLQWRHPRDASPPEQTTPFVQMPPLGTVEPLHMPVLLNKPQQERIEQNTIALVPTRQTKRRCSSAWIAVIGERRKKSVSIIQRIMHKGDAGSSIWKV